MKKFFFLIIFGALATSCQANNLYVQNCAGGGNIHLCADTRICAPLEKNIVVSDGAFFMPPTVSGFHFPELFQSLISGEIPQIFVVIETSVGRCLYRLEFDSQQQLILLKHGRVYDDVIDAAHYALDVDEYTLTIYQDCFVKLSVGLPSMCSKINQRKITRGYRDKNPAMEKKLKHKKLKLIDPSYRRERALRRREKRENRRYALNKE